MNDYYNRWFQKDCMVQFSNKSYEDFFESEKKLLALINENILSTLDIGCAYGKYYELIRNYFPNTTFSGIDIVDEQIRVAKKNYPNFDFWCGNVLKKKNIKKYDLVNATGVVQHEPNYNDLIDLILNISNKYSLFDLKIINSNNDICDINKSFCGDKNNKLLYNLLSFKKFYDYIISKNYISDIYLYGYETKINSRTVIPSNIKKIFSCGILLKKSKIKKNKINFIFCNKDISMKILT